MKKEHIRISIDISKDLNIKLRQKAKEKDMTMNAFVRIAIDNYIKNN